MAQAAIGEAEESAGQGVRHEGLSLQPDDWSLGQTLKMQASSQMTRQGQESWCAQEAQTWQLSHEAALVRLLWLLVPRNPRR